ncbi:MAG: glycosyltransferase family 39 protein [Burkholderiaceae bacterium]
MSSLSRASNIHFADFGSARIPRSIIAIGWLLFALVWFGSLGVRTLITPDEGRYAVLSLNMLASGDWITPRLNGLLYFEKPALQYWMGAIAFQLFGVNEFAARFWPGLAGFFAVGMVSFTGGRLWGQRAGVIAALLMGSMLWVYANTHYLTLDGGLMACLTVALCAFVLAQRDEAGTAERRRFMWLCWAAMAGATLSKGLVGLVIPGATLALYSLLNWQWGFWQRMHWVSGLAIYLLLAAPWLIAVSLKNPGFAEFFFIHEHFQRFLTTTHRREGAIWYFIPLLLVGLMPWTALLPALVQEGWKRSASQFQPARLLLIWSAFILAFFSVSSSKLPSYILPMFPALALLGAATLDRAEPLALRKILWLPIGLALIVLAALPFSSRFASASAPAEIVASMALAIGVAMAVMLVLALAGWWLLGRDRKLAAIACVAAGGLLSAAIGTSGHEAYGVNLKSARKLAAALSAQITPETPVYAVRDYDQTLPFYLGRNVTLVEYVDEFDFGEKQEPQRWVPTLAEFVTLWQSQPAAAASIPLEIHRELEAQGLPMTVVYQDRKRVAVVKPAVAP